MTGFEPATTRPPAVYANRTAPHPDVLWASKKTLFKIITKQKTKAFPYLGLFF